MIKIRIVGWFKQDGHVADIIEIKGDPFDKKGKLRAHQSRHLKRLLLDERISGVHMEIKKLPDPSEAL